GFMALAVASGCTNRTEFHPLLIPANAFHFVPSKSLTGELESDWKRPAERFHPLQRKALKLKDSEGNMVADLRDAVRQLRKAPGFTTTALLTLALGIGATTAIFTLVHQVMLKSLPVTKPGELWRIGDKDRCCNWGGYTQGDDGDFALFSWEA